MKKILIACLIGLTANLFASNQKDFVIRTAKMEYRFDCEDLDKIRDIQYDDDIVWVVFDTDEWAEMVAKHTGFVRMGKAVQFKKVIFADYVPDAHD